MTTITTLPEQPELKRAEVQIASRTARAHREVQALAVLIQVAQIAQMLLPQLQQLFLLGRRQPQHLRRSQSASAISHSTSCPSLFIKEVHSMFLFHLSSEDPARADVTCKEDPMQLPLCMLQCLKSAPQPQAATPTL